LLDESSQKLYSQAGRLERKLEREKSSFSSSQASQLEIQNNQWEPDKAYRAAQSITRKHHEALGAIERTKDACLNKLLKTNFNKSISVKFQYAYKPQFSASGKKPWTELSDDAAWVHIHAKLIKEQGKRQKSSVKRKIALIQSILSDKAACIKTSEADTAHENIVFDEEMKNLKKRTLRLERKKATLLGQ